MAITPLCKSIVTKQSEAATDLQTSLTATTITHFYGIASTPLGSGSKVLITYVYD